MGEATVFPTYNKNDNKRVGKGVGSNRKQVIGRKQCSIYQWHPTYPFIKL